MVANSDTCGEPTPLTIPLHSSPFCGDRSPKGKPCRRAHGHSGRHAFVWLHAVPGKVREVWDATCQVCGRSTDGAVCRECGAA